MWCNWLIPLLLLFGAALIGGFIGWLLRGNKIKTIREEYQGKIDALNQSISDEKEKRDALIKEHSTLQSQESTWNNKLAIATADALVWKTNADNNKTSLEKSLLVIKALENQLKEAKEVDNLSPELKNKLQEQKNTLEEKDTAIKKLEAALHELKENSAAKIAAVLEQKQALENQLQEQQNKESEIAPHDATLENQLKTKLQELEDKLEDQELEISTWSKQYRQLKNEKDKALKNYMLLEATTQIDIDAARKEDKKEIAKLQALLEKAKNKELDAVLANNSDQLELELGKLKEENKKAHKEIERLTSLLANKKENATEEDTDQATPSEEEATLQRIKEKAKDFDFERIGVSNFIDRDDLKIIKGVGPFIEKKLHALGIFTFGQIANLSSEDEDKVNDAIEFFPGRIKRDEWVKQGGELHKEKQEKKNEEDKNKDT